MNLPSVNTIRDLVFAAGESVGRDISNEEVEREIEEQDIINDSADAKLSLDRPSMYVVLMEDMLKSVCLSEYSLFSEDEIDVFRAFDILSYKARYLLARLLLRKPDAWHRLSKLRYQSEIGEHIAPIIDELCRCYSIEYMDVKMEDRDTLKLDPPIKNPIQVKEEDNEVIDLTLDTDGEEESFYASNINGVAEPLQSQSSASANTAADPSTNFNAPSVIPAGVNHLSYFCRDESSMSLQELIDRLTTDELRGLAKQMKLKTTQNRASLISALLIQSSTQSILNFTAPPNGKTKPNTRACDNFKQTILPFSVSGNTKGDDKENHKHAKEKAFLPTQEDRLRRMITKILGKCVRMNYDIFKLFRRVHIVYFRSTELPQKLILPSLLSATKKRIYPAYRAKRSNEVWMTREDLLTYEDALEVEARIDLLLESTTAKEGGRKTPVAKFAAPGDPASARRTLVDRATEPDKEHEEDADLVEGKGALEALTVKRIFVSEIYPKWKTLVVASEQENVRQPGFERFEPGYVYTHIVQKAAHVLSVLKEHGFELELLEALLAQRRWRRGSRGKWYDRRALVINKYFVQGSHDQKTVMLRRLRMGLEEALMDDYTGVVYRPNLVKRLIKVEKRLKLPLEERVQCEGKLKEATEVSIEGVRVWHRGDSLSLDNMGRVIKDVGGGSIKRRKLIEGDGIRNFFTPGSHASDRPFLVNGKTDNEGKAKIRQESWKGKSIWQGKDGEEVNVETLALQHYEKLGYRGFHSETRILTTIFGLIFWDILFADIPGAFETRYQTAPLDIAEDSFYYARKDLIDKRLQEIEGGKAVEYLEISDKREREDGTWCVGVRWDVCERQDLVEIVECIGGKSLAVICHLLCEDYAGRSSGVPDLVVWNAVAGTCKFVEVKGPGDRLQQNQQVWLDVLLRSGTDVEVCKVSEWGKVQQKKRGRGKPLTKTDEPKTPIAKSMEKPAVKEFDSGMESDGEEDRIEKLADNDAYVPQVHLAVTPSARISIRGTKRRAPPDDDDAVILPSFAPSLSSSATPSRRRGTDIKNRVEVLITSSPPKQKRRFHILPT